jgi:outer membrane protein OmpA-like peptidoglycan-associated protein
MLPKTFGASDRGDRKVGGRHVLALVAALYAAPAHGIDVHGFTLLGTSGTPSEYQRLGSTTLDKNGSWAAGLLFDYADTPLAEKFPWGTEPVLASLGTANVSGFYSFGGLGIDAVIPVHVVGVDQTGTFFAAGDARVGVRVPALREGTVRPSLGTQMTCFFPTGDATHHVGSVGPRVGVAVSSEKHFGRLGLIAMVGTQVSVTDEERNLLAGFGPMGGVGVSYGVTDALSVEAELVSQTDLTALPLEASANAHYQLPLGAWASLGAGLGLNDAPGAATWRATAGFGWSYRKQRAEVETVYVTAPVDPDADRDGDGIVDIKDACPDQAETIDGYTDDDGCPELDGDGDGVEFGRDQCPQEPIHPEQDPRWSDGCPQIAEFAGDRIVITQAIFFEEGRTALLPSAEPILAAVLEVMNDHPDIQYFLIEGHTNSNGTDSFNLRLSDARAFSVAEWLAHHGVDPKRLLSKGFGETRPVVPDDAPDAMAINRRVEFRVVTVEQIPTDARHFELPEEIHD